MLKALLVAPVSPVAVAVSVYPLPAVFRLKVENVATPFTAAAVLVPARVPLAGLVPIATVMLVVPVVTVLPWASWTATCTAGAFAAPATALLGCTVKTSFAAAPTPVGCTGPLPEQPPSATPQSTTPAQNLPCVGTRLTAASLSWLMSLLLTSDGPQGATGFVVPSTPRAQVMKDGGQMHSPQNESTPG